MKKIFFLFFLLSQSPIGYSQYKYDYNTNNSYNSYGNGNGGTTVRGYNHNSGSTWNTNIDRNGSMNGMDSKGNQWNYNSNTGAYINYGTWRVCTGTGLARVCNLTK